MALTKYEKETIINFNEEEQTATVYTHNERMRNKLASYAEKDSNCCLIRKTESCDEYRIPKSWIKINMPRQYSEEQRQKMAERARANLIKKNQE